MKKTDTAVALFVYGSLMFDKVWNKVVGRPGERLPCTLGGWQRLGIRGAEYPALVPGKGSVKGLLRLGLSRADMDKLDHFEGEEYRREELQVETMGGRTVPAQVYVFKEAYHHLLLPEPWSVEDFEENGLARFFPEIMARRYPE